VATFVDDISRYDGGLDALTADRADAFLFNVEDPQVVDKVNRTRLDLGKDWGLYGWEYPTPGSSAIPLMHDVADRVGQIPTKAGWVDYEQNGVSPADGWAAHDAAAGLGFPCGFYTYLYMLNSQDGLADVWHAFDLRWIAYYPGNNSGAYPASEIGSAQYMDSTLWQFTSSGGTRDRSVVVDDSRWAALGGTPIAAPQPQEDDMWIAVAPSTAFSVFGFLKGREFTGDRAFAGIPADAIEYSNSMKPPIPILYIGDAEAQGIIGASQIALTPSAVPLTDAQIKKLGAAVSFDPAVIAKAVNDDAAARMAS
jgi:hypothetical protein